MTTSQSYNGFTLIELIVSLTICTILLVIALPSWSYALNQTRSDKDISAIVTTIQSARMAAIKYGAVVTICPSSDQQHCNDNWQNGWIIFVDQDANATLDSEDDMILTKQAVSDSAQLLFSAFPVNNYLQMDPSGSTASQNGTFRYCPPNKDPQHARSVIISYAGRVRVEVNDGSDCQAS